MIRARPLEQILDLARWAPSGDNTQPWRFEVIDDLRFVIHGSDTRHHCVYDLDGHPSQLAIGALLETIRIAATGFGFRAEILRRHSEGDRSEEHPVYDVSLVADRSIQPSPLISTIPRRSVQRRGFSTKALSVEQKKALEGVLGAGYQIYWFETLGQRWQFALLMFRSAKIRLTTEEAYRVHSDIIAWDQQFSRDRVPDRALGS